MKITLKILKITFIAAIIIFLALAYTYHICNNKPHYGGALILMMITYGVLIILSGFEILLTNEVIK